MFMAEKGYGTAAKSAALDYLVSVCNNLTNAEQQGDTYLSEQKALRRRLRKELRRFREMAGVRVYNAPWLYTNAYPAARVPIRLWSRYRNMKQQE